MKRPITLKESATLARLLKRAIANGQFSLQVASPYPDDQWKRDGWRFNDRHDGMACASNRWNVEHGIAEGDHVNYDDTPGAPEFITGKRAGVCVYVGERDLSLIAGGAK